MGIKNFYSHRGYSLRKEYAPYGEHMLSFNSSPFSDVASSTVQNVGFDDTDTNMLRMCIHLLLIV